VSGTLFLVPTPLGDVPPDTVLAQGTLAIARRLRVFFVENAKSARAFLKAIAHPGPLAALTLVELGERTAAEEIDAALERVVAGYDAGIVSEAGCPGIADPGAEVVRRAHRRGIRVAPLVGPSSVVLALMASGLEGQRFAFHGYLPVERPALSARLRALEDASRRDDATQVWIETPYRSERMLGVALETCREDTRLCVAAALTLPTEQVTTRRVSDWRARPVEIGKRPAVFLLLACR
jgi:16S rRNA (cytidine1402-2'-O)-methyltransferase